MSRNQLTIAIGVGLTAVLAWILLSVEPGRKAAYVHAAPTLTSDGDRPSGGNFGRENLRLEGDAAADQDQPAGSSEPAATLPVRATDLGSISGTPGVRRPGLKRVVGPEPSQLDITVRDAAGKLVPGIVVRAYIEDPESGSVQAAGRTTGDHGDLLRAPTTDARGHCWIDVPAGSALRLIAHDDDGATLTGSLRVAALGTSELRGVELRLRAGKTIMQRVTAVDADTGGPAAGAVAWVLPRVGGGASAWELTAPDAYGGVSGGLAISRTTDRQVVLVISAASCAPVAMALHGDTDFDNVALRVPLKRGAVLEVVANDGAGRPVTGASITVSMHLPGLAVDEGRPLPNRQLQRSEHTDSFGHARFEGLPPGLLLSIRSPGLLGLPERLQLEPGENRLLPATLGGGVPVGGRITNADGDALVNETLWLVPADANAPVLYTREQELEAVFLRTDAKGRFAHDSLPAGSWWIGPSPLGKWVPHATYMEVTLPSPQISIDLKAHRPRYLEGRVIDGNGSGIPGVSVRATGPSGLSAAPDVSNDEGSFRIGPLPPGTWTAQALPGPGHHGSQVAGSLVTGSQVTDSEVKGTRTSEASTPLDLPLRQGAGLRATAIDVNGTLLKAFDQVLVTDLEGRVRSLVGEDATLEHVGLADGRFSICAILPDGRIALSEDIRTRSGAGPADVVLQFLPTARLEFQALAEAIPFRIWSGGTCVGLGRTRADVQTGIDVPAGTLTIEWRFPEGAREQAVTIAPFARHELKIKQP